MEEEVVDVGHREALAVEKLIHHRRYVEVKELGR